MKKKVAVVMAVLLIAGCQVNNIYADEVNEDIEKSEEVTSAVHEDVIKPVFKGLKNKTVYVGTKKIDYLKGVKATDNVDGNLTSKIKVNKSKVNLKKAGIYTVVYLVTDNAGNTATAKKKVFVKKDAKPVLKGVKNRIVYLGTMKVNYLQGVTATDKRDGNLTKKIKVNKSKVDLNKIGTYKVTYSVTDSSKNKTVKTGKIQVKRQKIEWFTPKPEKRGSEVNGDVPAGGKQGVGYW